MQREIELTNKSEIIIFLREKDKRLAKVIDIIGNLKYYVYDDSYVFLLHEIIEQMLSKKAGEKIFERVMNLCNGNIDPINIKKLTIEELRKTGMAYSKANYIKNLTNAVLNKEIDFEEIKKLNDDEVKKKLKSIKGIGEWTAQMYLIFVLNRNDVLPVKDTAFIQSYKWLYNTDKIKPNDIIKRCKKWKPYSSIASRYLYKALDTGLTKKEFKLYI